MSTDPNSPEIESKETGRIEAFSDGVFAIAITLLVLDIRVPRDLPENASLLEALIRQWPTYLAFVSSFLTIGIMWINHHRMFTLIRRSDNTFLLLNTLLLMGVTLVPFPTSLVAEYLRHRDGTVAAMVYGGTFTLIALCFNLLWRYAASELRLLDRRIDTRAAQAISRQYRFGPLLYLAAFATAFFSVALSLLIYIALAIFFALPPKWATST